MRWLKLGFLIVITLQGLTDATEQNSKFFPTLLDPYVHENGRLCSEDNWCLLIVDVTDSQGSDSLGSYNITTKTWKTSLGAHVVFSNRTYDDQGLTVYKQEFPDGLQGTSIGDTDGTTTAFPRLTLPTDDEMPGAQWITPGGYMTGWTLFSSGSVSDLNKFRDGEDGGIVVLFAPQNVIIPSVIVTPLNQPMATNVHLDHDTRTMDFGVQGLADSIPAGFTLEVIMREDVEGIVRNVMNWGAAVQQYHGSSSKIADPSIDYLSYWTDNGASLYYNPLPYTNFQDALIHVYNHTKENNIPIRSLQLDSWWYYKGAGGGVKNWTALHSILPDGIDYLRNVTGWPILAHNRYFSSDNDYAQQNGGDYLFTIDEESEKALPLDKQFWDDLFDESLEWGLSLYEQDWLDRQYSFTSALHSNISLGSSWLNNMGEAALERDLPIQYCMSYTRQMLHSVSLPAVTQIRVSDDYMLTPENWRIGHTSLFAHALGLAVFKDNFWSSRENVNVVFNDCLAITPDPDHLLQLKYSYGGWRNYAESGASCIPWTDFGWDDKYPGGGLDNNNKCMNPDNLHKGAWCFTTAGFDITESEWIWEYCDVPVCEVDCYLFNGWEYLGPYNTTQSGASCVDWAGEYNLNGAHCRNPTLEEQPWCYITEDHSERDFCNNKCVEAYEPNSELQSAVSTLSAGPVGLGDKAENLNAELIMKSCNAEGLILKPSKPLTVIDMYFVSPEEYREVWTAHSIMESENGNSLYFGIIFTAETDTDLTLTPWDLNLEQAFNGSSLVWNNVNGDLQIIGNSDENVYLPSCSGSMNFCLNYVSPIIHLPNGKTFAILGERSKWTPVSPQRIRNLTIDGNGIVLKVYGIQGETVTLAFFDMEKILSLDIDFEVTGEHLVVIG